jgi:hypothetical protein
MLAEKAHGRLTQLGPDVANSSDAHGLNHQLVINTVLSSAVGLGLRLWWCTVCSCTQDSSKRPRHRILAAHAANLRLYDLIGLQGELLTHYSLAKSIQMPDRPSMELFEGQASVNKLPTVRSGVKSGMSKPHCSINSCS